MIQVAMIFAAGRGERMRPLTDVKPKPLLEVAGKPLIVWQIEAIAQAGIHDIVINHAWLGEQIPVALGDGSQFGVRLHYSAEGEALETAGGIAKALPLLKSCSDSPIFLAVSGDVYTNYNYARLHAKAAELARMEQPHMHLVMVNNPSFHQAGDFALDAGKLYSIEADVGQKLTFGNIGLYDMRLFEPLPVGDKIPMSPYYRDAVAQGVASGEYFDGVWENVGTAVQLEALNQNLSQNTSNLLVRS
ncbi:N-acetylmuramate alpha-1-phosphate uridylyltransferase MurU [Hydromonas duriensis]|uniref:MurNAc alpha-1-phosphate uridylyltransferase n=1 Tax=Hydromonas duriensis TaxID=1527608 RepID=A0A4V3DJV0_9BURK|nr:nucleotidyltransferase family protein [Hydromonas duriensis]TDR31561.1 MurNAc alpha-1-phosphate uridylyltransferase [Hydromonas duriensis]